MSSMWLRKVIYLTDMAKKNPNYTDYRIKKLHTSLTPPAFSWVIDRVLCFACTTDHCEQLWLAGGAEWRSSVLVSLPGVMDCPVLPSLLEETGLQHTQTHTKNRFTKVANKMAASNYIYTQKYTQNSEQEFIVFQCEFLLCCTCRFC